MKSNAQTQDTPSLAQTLLRDALTLLPEDLRSQFQARIGSLSGNDERPSLAFILGKIYGADIEGVPVPVVVYYEGFRSIESVETRIKEGKREITNPEQLYRDQYNLALNLLVNLWLTDLRKDNSQVQTIPKEGVYLRDSSGELYFYQEG